MRGARMTPKKLRDPQGSVAQDVPGVPVRRTLYGTLSIPLGVQAQRFRTDSGFAFENSAWLKPRVGFASMSMNSIGMCFRHFLFATIVARTDFFRRGEACHI
jgi:hypothetical protein